MVYGRLTVSLAALSLFVIARTLAGETRNADDDKKAVRANTHEGTVVSVTADKLVMKGKARDGEEARKHTHTLAENAKVTCDGKACNLEELKPGQKIRVTTRGDDKTVATRVEALDKNEDFEKEGGADAEKETGKS